MSHRNQFLSRIGPLFLMAFLAYSMTVAAISANAAVPDPVLQWIGIMNDTVLAGGSNPFLTFRIVALVSASVFDAVNGIDLCYQLLYVKPNVSGNASRRATAVEAAY